MTTEWQPIKTAPTDGRDILIYGTWEGEVGSSDSIPSIYMVRAEHKYYPIVGTDYYTAIVRDPTHWHPLPSPPNRETIVD